MVYKGTVASVDAAAKSFVVHPAKGADVTLKVNDKTKYPKGKSWDDVKANAKVSATFRNDGTDNWALTVHFTAEKAKPARGRAHGEGAHGETVQQASISVLLGAARIRRHRQPDHDDRRS